MTKTEIEVPDPGELPPGTKPMPIRTEVPVQVGQSNGVDPGEAEAHPDRALGRLPVRGVARYGGIMEP